MSKFDQRTAHAKKLKRQRYSSQFCFFLFALAQCIISLCFFSHGNLYCFILFFILDFCYLFLKRGQELFIEQMRNSLDDMESKIHVGRPVIYKMPISSSVESSYLWESIRSRVLYRYRYHARNFDFNFLPADSSDPSFCAWAAAWFYANDDLEKFQAPDYLNFVILLADYGFQYDYLSDVAYEDWRNSIHLHYQNTEFQSIVDSFFKKINHT